MKQIREIIKGKVNQTYLIQTDNDMAVNFTFIHNRPRTDSNISICIMAGGTAHVTAYAKTIIEKTAPHTNAWLEIKVITRDQAIVTSAPDLEIANNAVKAGHALTTKHIDDEELFYMMSRGLTRDQAEKMIVDATIKPYLKGIIIS